MSENLGNRIYQVGQCILTDQVFHWDRDDIAGYSFEVKRIWETTTRQGKIYFDWPLHLAEKSWFTLEDIRDINLVFAFAIDYFQKPENCRAKLCETLLRQQQERLDAEN